MGNLSFETTRSDIEALFAQCGGTVDIAIPADHDTGRPRGFAFVEFADEPTAVKAIEMFDGYELEGRTLRVNLAEESQNRSRSFGSSGSFGNSRGPKGGFTNSAPTRGKGNYKGGYHKSKPKGSRRNIRAQKRGY